MMRGKFISLEGSEGAGKSTALDFIKGYFARTQREVVFTREPGGTEIAEEIRHVLLHRPSEEIMRPETELLLMFASRAQHVQACIEPALRAGRHVVSDRFIDASYAYQGGGRGINQQQIAMLDKLVVGDTYPDLTLLLDVPVEIGVLRTEKRGGQKDRIEKEQIDFFERVRQAYLLRAKEDPARIKIIDASQPLTVVQLQIQETLDAFFSRQLT